MPPVALSSYLVRLSRSGPQALATLDVPVLLWDAPLPGEGGTPEDVVLGTAPALHALRGGAGDPLVFEVRKSGASAADPFPMGVTVGRTEGNDVCLPHPSVSRFHAYLQQEASSGGGAGAGGGGGWRLVDAESRNGTRLGPLRLTPGQPEALSEGARLRFGDLVLTFHTAAGFTALVRRKLGLVSG
jgi:hypothetical protein